MPSISPAMHAWLRERVSGAGVMPFDIFIRHALYAPGIGYYSRHKQRVGRNFSADFYTATSLGKVFRELVLEACQKLLPDSASNYSWIELGAEPGTGLLEGLPNPFATTESRSLGQSLQLEGNLVVFSNELFDAQPFRRFIVYEGTWRERGVRIDETGIREELLPPGGALAELPASAPEGYEFDAPTGAIHLLHRLVQQPWQGLFIAFDYGLSYEELISARPIGTARTYHQHRQGTDLLTAPGEHDITCHVCWDWLTDTLNHAGFAPPILQRQEAFFMHHSTQGIERIIKTASTSGGINPALQTLKELIHPENMGSKFQVLHAVR